MSHHIPCANTKLNKAMNPEQFNQIVEAILAGKYSWACVLILRFAGYNPLHYIPYRTYNRLLKENCQNGNSGHPKQGTIKSNEQDTEHLSTCLSNQEKLSRIADLNYLEVVGEKSNSIQGGHRTQGFNEQLEDYSINWELASRQTFSTSIL